MAKKGLLSVKRYLLLLLVTGFIVALAACQPSTEESGMTESASSTEMMSETGGDMMDETGGDMMDETGGDMMDDTMDETGGDSADDG